MNIFVDPYQIRRAIRDGFRTTIAVGGDIVLSAGTLSTLRSDVTFSNSNGVSFGLDAAGVITASVAPAGGGLTNVKFSAGTQSDLRSDITFSNSNGVTFGLNAGTLTASVKNWMGTAISTQSTTGSDLVILSADTNGFSLGVPKWITTGASLSAINISAGSTSSNVTAFTFSNGSGVTFGFDGSNITASVQTNYQAPGAYLTTAALSQDSSKYAGTGFTSATTAGTDIVATLATNGLSMGVPAYLTTSPAGTISAVKFSAGTLSSNRTDVTFSNSGGVSFGLETNGVITATVATNYAGQGFTTASTAGTDIVGTLSTNGLSMGIPAFLTAAGGAFTPRLDQVLDPNTDKVFNMASNQVQFQYAVGGSFSTNATRQGMFEIDVLGNVTQEADVVHIHQHNVPGPILDMVHVEADGTVVTGLRLQMSASIAAEINQPIKFTTEDAGFPIGSVPLIIPATMSNSVANLNANYLQGRVSTQFAGLGFTSTSTAGTAVVATLSTNGLSMGIPAYLTTAAAGSGAGTGFTTATTIGTEVVGTLDTNGLSMGVPAYLTTATGGVATNAVATLSFFENAAIISANLSQVFGGNQDFLTNSNQGLYFNPFVLPQAISASYIRLIGNHVAGQAANSGGTTVNSSATASIASTINVMFFTQMTGASSRSLGHYTAGLASIVAQTSVGAGATGSNYTVSINITFPQSGGYTNTQFTKGYSSANYYVSTSQLTNFTGLRYLDVPFAVSLSPGNYWIALGTSTQASLQAGYPANISGAGLRVITIMGHSQNGTFIGMYGSTTNFTVPTLQPGLGNWSTNVALSSTSIANMGAISAMSQAPRVIFQMLRQA